MRLDDLRVRLRELGAGAPHERAVLRAWVHARSLDHGPRPAIVWGQRQAPAQADEECQVVGNLHPAVAAHG